MTEPDQIIADRRKAEQDGTDAELFRTRSLERACEALPPVIDGVRRNHLLWADAISSTWSGWSIEAGRQTLLRCLRPDWRSDPVMRRRMARGQRMLPAICAGQWCPDGDWPHLRLPLPGPLLIDSLPLESPLPTDLLAGLLTRALAGLCALHAEGLHLGGDLAAHLSLSGSGPKMIWLDRFDPPGSAQDDLINLGMLAQQLSPDARDPLARVVADWAANPPPSAMDGAVLLRQTMSQTLLAHRHRLRQSHRTNAHLSDVARLSRLVERLAAWPPPPAAACLSANDPEAPVLVICDGERIISDGAVVFSPSQGLHLAAYRKLARAWRRRSAAMEEARLSVQTRIGGQPGEATSLIRWMTARSQLRTLRLLMVGYSSSRVSR